MIENLTLNNLHSSFAYIQCDENGSRGLEATTKLSFLISPSQYHKNRTCWSFSFPIPFAWCLDTHFHPTTSFFLLNETNSFSYFSSRRRRSLRITVCGSIKDKNGKDFSQLLLLIFLARWSGCCFANTNANNEAR